jgi:hypothetical protein
MNKINKFFDEAPLWKVYIFGYISSFLIILLVPPTLDFMLNGKGSSFLSDLYVMFSIGVSFLVACLFNILTLNQRKNKRFWEKAKDVERLILTSKSLMQLDIIFDDDFKELKDLSFLGHQDELKRLESLRDFMKYYHRVIS